MRLPRMTTRRWMFAVAVLGIGLAGRIQWKRWEALRPYYEALAELHADRASQLRQFVERTRAEWIAACREVDERNRQRALRRDRWDEFYPPDPEEARRAVEYFSRLAAKYERAARYPWLSVEPDPPMSGPTDSPTAEMADRPANGDTTAGGGHREIRGLDAQIPAK